jgi:hypothetical protein
MDPNIVAALIGAGVASISILLKDYLLDIIKEKRQTKQTKDQTFKLYANPIIRASESLCWRLKEIFEQRGAFLLEKNPKNEFFTYKYLSTVYRLSVLISWKRAINREFAYIDTSDKSGNREIENSFNSFQKALADGQHMELSILKELVKCWNIPIDKISNEEQAKLAVKIEEIKYSAIKDDTMILAKSLFEAEQISLLEKISNTICEQVKCTKIPNIVIEENRNKAINEISRIENWIYRDWQNAIGDLILVTIKNSPRMYDIIGFGEFDELLSKKNKWLDRINRLFENLNIEIDDRFDARVGQLKRIYKSTVEILSAFNDLNKNQETISLKSLNNLKAFGEKL